MEFFYVSLLFLFVFLMSLLLIHFSYKNKSPLSGPSLPPGKIGWPIFGESLEFLFAGLKGHPEKFINDRIAKYSSNVFRTHLLGEHVAILSGAWGNKFLFSNENKLVRVWWPNSLKKIFPSTQQRSTLIEEEGIKRKQFGSSMLSNFLKPKALQRYVGVMDDMTRRPFASGWENHDQVFAYPLVKDYTFSVACRLFVNIEDPNHVAKLAKPFDDLAPGVISIPIQLPGTPFNRAIKASNFIRKELLTIVKQRKIELGEGKLASSSTQDLLTYMLLTCDEDGKFMEESEIADKVLGLLVGGHDTLSSACTSIVKYLAELPHIYQGVYQEQMEITKSKSAGELLKWEDINKMKYSWNVACEVLRLAPPAQGFFREVLSDFIFNGFSIPKGWKIYWSTYSTHKSSEFFPEPEKFDPSRFEGSGPAPYTYVPFGGGPRMCPGMAYARLEILIFMHHLVSRFKMEKIIPDEKIIAHFIRIPADGLPVRLYRHDL